MRLNIRSTHSRRLVGLLSLILSVQLFAGTPHIQTDSPTAQTSPRSAAANSKHSAQAKNAIKYRNTKYGFTFSLPATWKGYTTVESTWEGYDNNGPHGREVLTHGSEITLVNPHSVPTKHYQDIYIMVFTHHQWNSLQRADFEISAAPVGPGEYGRNNKYVFAEPPRMIGYDDSYGTEEVLKIMRSKPLHPFDIPSAAH